MRLSVERLRWGPWLAGAVLLVGVVVVLLGYGRYRAVQAWKQIVKRSGATITHETDGVTWSQALGGKQIFTLHGKRVIPHGEGRYTLEDGMLVLYGPNGQPADRISGAQFEYDEKQGVAHAAGVVDMDIEPPAALTGKNGNAGGGKLAAAPQAIHVRTSGLTYVKKLGVAATGPVMSRSSTRARMGMRRARSSTRDRAVGAPAGGCASGRNVARGGWVSRRDAGDGDGGEGGPGPSRNQNVIHLTWRW